MAMVLSGQFIDARVSRVGLLRSSSNVCLRRGSRALAGQDGMRATLITASKEAALRGVDLPINEAIDAFPRRKAVCFRRFY